MDRVGCGLFRGWSPLELDARNRCFVGVGVLSSREVARDQFFRDVRARLPRRLVVAGPLHQKLERLVAFPTVLEDAVNEPSVSGRVLRGKVLGRSGVAVFLRRFSWRRCGGDSVYRDTFHQRSTLDDGCSCGNVELPLTQDGVDNALGLDVIVAVTRFPAQQN